MHVRLAASAAWLMLYASGVTAAEAGRLSLSDAFARVADAHPELRWVDARAAVLTAERGQAERRPPWEAGAEIENAFGTGQASGLDSAELTLTLASVLELGGRLDARRTLAKSHGSMRRRCRVGWARWAASSTAAAAGAAA
jgi:cobalt-zinc-cadmium efflux system outer membrane protein